MKHLFCARCQAITEHAGSVDMNGEFVFRCQTESCDRFIKFPSDIDATAFNELALKHKAANEGQVSLEEQEARLDTILSEPDIAYPEVEVQPEAPVEEVPAEEAPVEEVQEEVASEA